MADRSVVVRLIADTSSYNSGMRGAARSTREVGVAGRSTVDVLGRMKTVIAGFAVGGIVKAGIDFDALKQRSQAAFTTMTGSAAVAKKELSDLYGVFKNNPYGYPAILKTAQQLTAMGVTGDKLIPTLTAISDSVAAVGGGADTFDRVALAIGQMNAKGTVQAEEIRQLAENGIPAWQLLAKEIGVSVPEAMKLSEKRMIDAKTGVAALMAGIEERFGGATANMRNTWTGTWTAFKTEATQAGGEIAVPIMRIGTDGMHAIQPLLKGIGEVATGFSSLPTPLQNTTFALGAVMLMSGRLNSAWMAMSGSGVRFAEQMRVQQALAAASGASLSRLGAVATVASLRMRAAGSALMGAFGGPLGIAIMAITLGLSIYSQRQAEASAAVAKHKSEVQALTSEIDRNTMSLNRNSADTKLSTLTYGETDKGKPLYTLDFLNQIPGAAQLARKAIEGDMAALNRLKSLMKRANGGEWSYGTKASFNTVAAAARNAVEATHAVTNEMRLRIPEAAQDAGVSTTQLKVAFRDAQTSGTSLKEALRNAGLTAAQAAVAYNILAGSADNAAGGMFNAANAAAQMRKDVATAAGQFVSIGGAWDTAQQNANAAQSAGGGGGSSKTPSASDDPAYKRAKRAYEDQYAQLRRLKQADKDRLGPVRDAAKADADAAAAAKKRADAMKRVATEAKSASDKAKDALKQAQQEKDQADRNAHDAAALAAEVRTEAGRSGSADSAAFAAAQVKADHAAAVATREQTQATKELGKARTDASTAGTVSTKADAAAKAAKKQADELAAIARGSARVQKKLQDEIEHVEARAERKHEQLLQAKSRAEQKAQERTQRYADAVGGAYGSAAKQADVSLDAYLGTLRKQVEAQHNWRNNLIKLATEVPPGVAQQLAKLGPQAAPLVQKLVDGTSRQVRQFVALFGKTGDDATAALSRQIALGIPLIAAVGRQAGQATAQKLAQAIIDGKTTVGHAMTILKAHVSKDGVNITLGIANRKAVQDEIDDIVKNHRYAIEPWTGPHGEKGFKVVGMTTGPLGGPQGYAEGGWVRGGSGARDDVMLPNRNRGAIATMGGEFVVRKSIAQANKRFFDAMDRTGRMPATPAPQVVVVPVTTPAAAPAARGSIVFGPGSIVQQPGQSALQLVREIDRVAVLGSGL